MATGRVALAAVNSRVNSWKRFPDTSSFCKGGRLYSVFQFSTTCRKQELAGICLYWVKIVHGESVPID